MNRHALSRPLACVLIGLSLAIGGCEKKISMENYNKVTDGMTLSDVTKILGKGTKEAKAEGTSISQAGIMDNRGNASPEDTYAWKDGAAEIVITFRDGKVVNRVSRNLP